MAQEKDAEIIEAPGGRTRVLSGRLKTAVSWFCALGILFHVLYLGNIFEYANVSLGNIEFRGYSLFFILAVVYLLVPSSKRVRSISIPWYDWLAIALAALVNISFSVNYQQVAITSAASNVVQQAFGIILIVLVLEAVRRSIGLVLTIIGVIFFIYPMVANYLPGILHTKGVALERFTDMVYLYPYGIYGEILAIFSTTIIAFLVFGAFLDISGAGKFLINIALSMAGRFRGGPAKVAVIASAFLGSVNGSAIANVATTGVITIPLMKRVGYRPHFAGAVEAVASNGGQIMPPVMGVAAFLMMDFLELSYLEVIIAAILPAILYFFALLIMVHLEAVRTGLQASPREDLPSLGKVLKDGWVYLVPVGVLVYFLGFLRFTPGTSCIYAILSLLLVTAFSKDKRMGPGKIFDAMSISARTIPAVGSAVAVAGGIVALMNLTGLGFRLGNGLVLLANNNFYVLLIFTALTAMVLGMGMPTSGVYLITALLLAPALIILGMQPIVAHFYVFYYGLAAMLTPPICMVAFVGASIAGAPFFKTGWEAMRLGIVVFLVPFAFALSPELLLIGEPGAIALAVVKALIGVAMLSFGLQGYISRPLAWIPRILMVLAGISGFAPSGFIPAWIGLGIGFVIVIWEFLRARRAIALST